MSDFINTVEVVDDETLVAGIIEDTVTEFKDDTITALRTRVFYNNTALTLSLIHI